MNKLSERWHALRARILIEKCGGVTEAASACRWDAPRLSRAQTPGSGVTMPIDVVAELERYCGDPVYSRAMVEAITAPPAPAEDLKAEACEATEAVAELQREIRLATGDGQVTPREQTRLTALHEKATQQLRDAGDAIERATG